MDKIELAHRAMAELAPLGNGLGLGAAMQVAETDELAPHMLSALLGQELVAGHATMMKLSAKVDRWLALVADDRSPEDQDRGNREAVRLAIAAARLSERYRVGLASLVKLRGWEGFRKARTAAPTDDLAAAADIAAALLGDGDGLDDGPPDGPNGNGPKGGARSAAKALQQLQALRAHYGNGHTNGNANGHTQNSPSHFGRGLGGGLGAGSNSSSAPANRGKLRHGNPSGDFLAAPRCGAKTRAACPCRQPAMANGRCRMHGGKSTGARNRTRPRPRPRQPPGPRRPQRRDHRPALRRVPSRPRPPRPRPPDEGLYQTSIRAIHPMPSDEHRDGCPAVKDDHGPSFARRSGLREGGSGSEGWKRASRRWGHPMPSDTPPCRCWLNARMK
jgi:hypothetical protein